MTSAVAQVSTPSSSHASSNSLEATIPCHQLCATSWTVTSQSSTSRGSIGSIRA